MPVSEIQKRLQSAQFITSVAKLSQMLPDTGTEVAFAGRSNAGKSSVINTICGQTRLAHTSKTPGRTQMLNFFSLGDEEHRLVDLPGYGFAKVARQMQANWEALLEEYLSTRASLRGIVLVMDIRHPLKPYDIQLIAFAEHTQIPLHILLNKADKLKRGPAGNTRQAVQKEFKSSRSDISVQTFSALKRDGLESLYQKLSSWLENVEQV